MSIKIVTETKFNAIIEKGVTLKNCPKCHFYGGEIIIGMPLYGKTEGIRARCCNCGFETRTYSSSLSIRDDTGRIGNPRTPKSILTGIMAAIKEYNKKPKKITKTRRKKKMKKSETLKNFGEVLKQKRSTLGWTQRRLADELNTSQLCVWKWETGRALPNLALLLSIADIFACSLDELIGKSDKAWHPPVKIGQKVYAALLPVIDLDEPIVEEYEVKGIAFDGKWYVGSGDGEWIPIGEDECKLTRKEAETVIEEWRSKQ